jgi:hypothetical protein
MSNSKLDNYLKLKLLISKDEILLLPHIRYKRIRKIYIYARCGLSLKYFEKAYENKKALLQFGEFGPRVGSPIPWQDALGDYMSGKMEKNGKDDNDSLSSTKNYLTKKLC